MNFFKIINSNKGFSLPEVMVSVAMFGVAAYLFVGSSNFLEQRGSETANKLNIARIAHNYYLSIQQDVSQYQASYDAEEFLSVVNKADLMKELPLAWNDKIVTDATNCKSCKGRLGYVISPLSGYRGMYKLTIRVTHSDDKIIPTYLDYDFLITGK